MIMVQKIHPRCVIWVAFFPPPVDIFSKKSAECSVHLYSSPCLIFHFKSHLFQLVFLFLLSSVYQKNLDDFVVLCCSVFCLWSRNQEGIGKIWSNIRFFCISVFVHWLWRKSYNMTPSNLSISTRHFLPL